MKIALLGKGKTGGKILELAKGPITVFDSKNPITLERIQGHDVIISFLPGHVFKDYLHLLLESKIPVVTGSTGFDWPENFNSLLQEAKVQWVYSNNFSLGMNVVKLMIEKMKLLKNLFPNFEANIHEVHHIHKKDSPSGTALSWKEWFGGDCSISADREGDVVGFHEISFNTSTEVIKLSHEAKNRQIFAQGALWAAELLYKDNKSFSGLMHFNDLVKTYLKI